MVTNCCSNCTSGNFVNQPRILSFLFSLSATNLKADIISQRLSEASPILKIASSSIVDSEPKLTERRSCVELLASDECVHENDA